MVVVVVTIISEPSTEPAYGETGPETGVPPCVLSWCLSLRWWSGTTLGERGVFGIRGRWRGRGSLTASEPWSRSPSTPPTAAAPPSPASPPTPAPPSRPQTGQPPPHTPTRERAEEVVQDDERDEVEDDVECLVEYAVYSVVSVSSDFGRLGGGEEKTDRSGREGWNTDLHRTLTLYSLCTGYTSIRMILWIPWVNSRIS